MEKKWMESTAVRIVSNIQGVDALSDAHSGIIDIK